MWLIDEEKLNKTKNLPISEKFIFANSKRLPNSFFTSAARLAAQGSRSIATTLQSAEDSIARVCPPPPNVQSR